MREIIQFSEEHPAILVSEIVAIMPPVKIERDSLPEPWRVTFVMRGGSSVHVDIYPEDFTPSVEQVEAALDSPYKPRITPRSGDSTRSINMRVAAIMFVHAVAMRFFKDSVETWRNFEESDH